MRMSFAGLVAAALLLPAPACPVDAVTDFRVLYEQQVDRRLAVPADEQRRYAAMLEHALRDGGVTPGSDQFVVLVDRSPLVQAVLLFWRASSTGTSHLIGASPASTGRPSGFEHFETPLGVFAHTIDNPDFRAEGTCNELGICGYGARGMRVFDFGWVPARRGWGKRDVGPMRLQMHATDPRYLEPRLGTRQSKGCIRIPATLNRFIDHHGILDADYDAALVAGARFWMLSAERAPTPWSGRYLVVVESVHSARPEWARVETARRP